ncbi:SH2 domain-containing protein 1B-like [Rhinophrynus dorsalis]
MDLPFYHGRISKKTGENLLIQHGKNGSYLIRDSESIDGVFCLCILFGRLIYTYRIFQDNNGYYKIQTAIGVKEKIFKEIRDLVANYEKPDQGLVHSLLYPVYKEMSMQIFLQSSTTKKLVSEETYAEVDDRVYVEVLPSKTVITNPKTSERWESKHN